MLICSEYHTLLAYLSEIGKIGIWGDSAFMNGNSYYYRKIHSLLGVIPIGFFLVEHLVTNYSAYNEGQAGFQEKIQ